MKKFMPLVIFLLLGAFTNAQENYKSRSIKILPSSELTIIGDTNISKFQCGFDTSFLNENQTIKYLKGENQILFSGAVLVLNTRGFDCGNKGINNDFHDLIKSKKHPEILLELEKAKLASPTKGLANVKITIAGLQKQYEVPVKITNGETATFKGILELNINDFGLEPPKKLFGMIVVKDEIEISFDLKVR